MCLRRLLATRGAVRPTDVASLGIVRAAECDQVPLVVLCADVGSAGVPIIGCGLHSFEMKRVLTTEVLGRVALREAAERHRQVPYHSVPGAWRAKDRLERIDAALAERAVIASSARSCIERTLIRKLQGTTRPAGGELDLLALRSGNAQIVVLQQALRLRKHSLPGLLDRDHAPVYIWHGEQDAAIALGFEEMVLEALMRAVAHAYLTDPLPQIYCVPDQVSALTKRRRVRAALARLAPERPFEVGEISVLGQRWFFCDIDRAPDLAR